MMHFLKFTIIALFLFTTNISEGQDKSVKSPLKNDLKSKEVRCSCPAKGSVEQEFEEASMVFVGQVIELRPKYPLHKGHTYVRFLASKKYKGFESYPNKESVVVFNPEPSDPCSMKFIKGNDYLVFAKGNPAYLKTSNCGHVGLQEDRVKEIIELDKKK